MHMKHSFIIIVLLFLTFEVFAQRTRLECLTVGEQDGSVTLKFSGPSSTTHFLIYRSTSINGAFDLIHTTTSGVTDSYVDEDVNAASQSFAYYVASYIDDNLQEESGKVRTILLSVNNLDNGLVDMSWNDPGFEPLGLYQIWRKGTSNSFEELDVSSGTAYIDTIRMCEATYYYQIRVMTKGCESISNVRGGIFKDNTQPDLIVPENASVDIETGEIRLSWLLPSIENADIRKYMIWMMNEEGESNTQYPIAEVYGYHNLSILMDQGLVCDTTLTFSVTAQDSCGNSCVWTSEYFIRTVNLHAPEYNICNDECLISWDSLRDWQDISLQGVRVYEKVADGEFELVADVPATETEVSLFGFERDIQYRFYIEAYSEGNTRTSTSCIKKIIGRKPVVTEYTWLRSASVVDGKVELKWQVDSVAYIPQFAVTRSEDGGNYEVVDTVYGNSDTLHYYTDISSLYYRSPQFYVIHPYDSCLNMGEGSNVAMTMNTSVSSYANGEALIEWTPYAKMDSIIAYQVYRVIDTLIYPFPVGEVYPESELSYVDRYDQSVPLTAKVGYFVEAVGYFTDSMPVADTARSNVNFLAKLSNVFIPSGFDPDGGVTSTFMPIYTGIKMENYSFKILNRWGMMLYESNQPVLGWNGKFQGERVPPGAYAYVLTYETLYGKAMRKSGVFFVL